MRYCSNCGMRLPDEARFCPGCGSHAGEPMGSRAVYDAEKERREAIDAGMRALDSLQRAKDELNSARGWGFVDILGGGLISGLVKRSKMSNARELINRACEDLRYFSRELNDVAGIENINIDTDDFLGFADLFFDGFAADFLTQDRINRARRQVDDAIGCVSYALDMLGLE